MKKWWLLGIGVLLVAAAVVVYMKMDTKKDPKLAAVVTTATVTKGTIDVQVSGTGSLAPTERQTVKASKQGTISTVKVAVGDKVKKGDVLATIEGVDNADKIKNEQLNLESKKLDLQDMQNKLASQTDENMIASTKLSIKKQQLSIDQSKATIADLQSAEASSQITAPIGGTVTTLSVAAGDSLNPSSEIAEISNYESLQMVVAIDELDISKVKLGQTANVSVEAMTNNSYTGKVIKIADEGTSSNGVASFDVTIALDKAEGLKSGMSAEASIDIEKKDNVLMLPIDAVHSVGNRYIVMVPTGSEVSGQGTGQNGASPTEGQTSQGGQGSRGNRTGGQGSDSGGWNRTGGQGQGGYNGANRTGGQGGARSMMTGGGTPQMITVGIHNEDYIEVLSGLKEGDKVILPTVISSSNNNAKTQQGGASVMGLGGIGGMGGMGGGQGGQRLVPSGGSGGGGKQ